MTVITKQEYRSPADILKEEAVRLGLSPELTPKVVSPAPILGTWINCNHQTRGLVRLMVAANGNEITVHGFGACVPNPCDWGTAPGLVYGANVASDPAVALTATYNFGFKQTIITGFLLNGALVVQTFDHFTDQSGRDDYYSMDIMSQ